MLSYFHNIHINYLSDKVCNFVWHRTSQETIYIYISLNCSPLGRLRSSRGNDNSEKRSYSSKKKNSYVSMLNLKIRHFLVNRCYNTRYANVKVGHAPVHCAIVFDNWVFPKFKLRWQFRQICIICLIFLPN